MELLFYNVTAFSKEPAELLLVLYNSTLIYAP